VKVGVCDGIVMLYIVVV